MPLSPTSFCWAGTQGDTLSAPSVSQPAEPLGLHEQMSPELQLVQKAKLGSWEECSKVNQFKPLFMAQQQEISCTRAKTDLPGHATLQTGLAAVLPLSKVRGGGGQTTGFLWVSNHSMEP